MGPDPKALARAFRWKRLLESAEFVTIAELAEREGIAPTYMTRVLRLTLLAPDIVEAILDGTLGPELTLARVLVPVPVEWSEQRERCWQTNSNRSPHGQSHCPLCRAETAPLGKSGGAIGLKLRSTGVASFLVKVV